MAGTKSISIKLKTSKQGQQILKNLDADTTVQQLKDKITEITNISQHLIKVLVGFPPKPLDLSNNSEIIDNCGIKNGDTLIVVDVVEAAGGVTDKGASSAVVNSTERGEYGEFDGILMKQIVPADNSCLFTSIGYVLNGKVDTNCGSFMRDIIASTVENDPTTFNEGILGRPNLEYCEWIKRSDSWGGAIEVSILSNLYGIEIDVVDVTNVIINRFGEDKNFGIRAFLLFDGIHYDPIYLQNFNGGGPITMFPAEEEKIYEQALDFARECNSSRQYTNVDKFSLRCLQCDTVLVGQKDAQEHAKQTGHDRFGEI